MGLTHILISIFLLITFVVMVFGIVAMAIGGEFAKKHGNSLMAARVTSQAVVVLLVAVLYFIS